MPCCAVLSQFAVHLFTAATTTMLTGPMLLLPALRVTFVFLHSLP